jgi:hypothetical protein
MDLQDWFDNTVSPSSKSKSKTCALTETIRALHGALVQGGRVFFRSAGQKPWYLELYRREGFMVECIHERVIGGKEPIDRVNMFVQRFLLSITLHTDAPSLGSGTPRSIVARSCRGLSSIVAPSFIEFPSFALPPVSVYSSNRSPRLEIVLLFSDLSRSTDVYLSEREAAKVSVFTSSPEVSL